MYYRIEMSYKRWCHNGNCQTMETHDFIVTVRDVMNIVDLIAEIIILHENTKQELLKDNLSWEFNGIQVMHE